MTRETRLAFMFAGPPSTLKREQGLKDARAGKPPLSRDEDYRRGYDLGQDFADDDSVKRRRTA